MDQVVLAATAEKLEKILQQYAPVDSNVSGLLRALAGVIALARAGKILAPLDARDIPGGYMFVEGELREYSELELAYAEFRIEATGGETPLLRELRLKGIGNLGS
jgi:hypothetical protein